MAIKVYDGTNWDDVLYAETISTANTNLTTSFQTGVAVTAPNTTNKITGVAFFLVALPSSGNIEIEVRESGTSKVSGIANFADLKVGWNYIRFATPYTFTTTTAGAYVAAIRKVTVSNGTVARSTSTSPFLVLTYNTAGALGAADDAFVMGFHDSGFTTKTLTLSGTSNAWGSGTDRTATTTTARSMGSALTIGNGGTVLYDNTASTKLKLKGNAFVLTGGLFDMRANATDIAKVSTLEFDNATADGDFGIQLPPSFAGQFLATGMTVNATAQYASGLGTTASPVVTVANHGFRVNDELVFGGASDYLKNEVRYVKSIPANNQLILSNTIGGAESALAQTHAANSYIGNMTRNSVITATTSTRGWWIYNNGTVADSLKLDYVRGEYSCCVSGKAIQLHLATSPAAGAATIDGFVHYDNAASGRTSIIIAGTAVETFSNIILYNTRGSNFNGQSGLGFSGGSNKTINGLYHYAAPSSTTNCAALSFIASSTNNTVNNLHSYGANAVAGSFGYAIGGASSAGNTFTNCTINAARTQGVWFSTFQGATFNNCTFGTIASATSIVLVATATLNDALFSDCSFGSGTLLSNYLNTLEGSEIRFHQMDGNANKSRWYNNHGSFWSSGSGLTDTTVRTASSLALAIKPEDATNGAFWEFLIPAVPSSQCGVSGYAYRNATFSSGTFKVELFLPGSTSADASYTFATTTGSWLPFNISAYYSGSVSRYATVRITAITATAGAYAFIDDLYDAGTGNKVAGLDLWYAGKPSTIMVASDTSAIPAQVWAYSDQTTSANTMGQRQVDAADDAELAAIK